MAEVAVELTLQSPALQLALEVDLGFEGGERVVGARQFGRGRGGAFVELVSEVVDLGLPAVGAELPVVGDGVEVLAVASLVPGRLGVLVVERLEAGLRLGELLAGAVELAGEALGLAVVGVAVEGEVVGAAGGQDAFDMAGEVLVGGEGCGGLVEEVGVALT